jgi:hypothetical protein
MVKKTSILLAFILCIQVAGISQSVSPDVIATCGDFFSNASGQLQWTLGETITETYSSANNTITQGFHQPNYGIPTSIESPNVLIPIFYPNPFSYMFFIQFGQEQKNLVYDFSIYDSNGKKYFRNAAQTQLLLLLITLIFLSAPIITGLKVKIK